MTQFNLKSRDFLKVPEQKREFNLKLFSAIAQQYPSMSRLLSFGRDPAWKKRMIGDLPYMSGPECLDMACGNGDLSALMLEKYPDASVTALDLTAPMLKAARKRFNGISGVRFLKKDMANTGLPGSAFDIIAVGYGLRNAPDIVLAMAEIGRLLKPGGFLAVLEFSRPDSPFLSGLQLKILALWSRMWGFLCSGNPDTYGYIADSLARFPARSEFYSMLSESGFTVRRSRRYFFGIVETIIAEKKKT